MATHGTSLSQQFARTEALGGVLLLLSASVALGLANSPWADRFAHVWDTRIALGPVGHALTLTLRQWINDGLMTLFFLLVGLEIKRELLAGELSSPRHAALPIAGAIGGMVVPALLYWSINAGKPGAPGWGIPMATDIAFALAALALVAPRAPIGARVFLTALAIVDDMGAVVVIALFYSGVIAWGALQSAALTLVLIVGLHVARVRRLWPYLTLGAALWFFVHESGVHATIAGVLLALAIPTRTRIDAAAFSSEARALLDKFDRSETGDLKVLTSKGQQEALMAIERAAEGVNAPLLRLEHGLHNLSAFVVMPLFALSNAGVSIGGQLENAYVTAGVLVGLLIGKPAGITAAAYIAVRFGLARLPEGVTWGALHGYAWLGGIGFTMSLFIAMLAFEDAGLLTSAKVGIVFASLTAGILGAIIVNLAKPIAPQNSHAREAPPSSGNP